MRILWLISGLFIIAAGISLLVTDDTKVSMLLVIAGSAINLVDQYRERRR